MVKGVLRKAGIRRSTVAAARLCCERYALSALPRAASPRSRILCYHSVGTPAWGVNDVSPRRFERHITMALEAGYRFVPAELLAAGGGQPRDLAITFDDGLRSVLDHAAPILRAYNVPATLFVVTGWADGEHRFGDGTMLDWRAIETLVGAGVRIGSHSVTHVNFGGLDRDAALAELGGSRRAIRERIGVDATSFAIPIGRAKDWSTAASSAAREVGYETVYAQAEDRRSPGTVARTFITRFDGDRIFRAALNGAFDRWEEWT